VTTLVWFCRDLRLSDQPALAEAAKNGCVIPVFIHAPDEETPWKSGAASDWWLHHSLKSLDDALRKKGSRLILRRGESLAVLRDLVRETGSKSVFWSRRYDPALIDRDAEIKKALTEDGLDARSFKSSLLFEPWEMKTKTNAGPFQVFTPFWKACLAKGVDRSTLPEPENFTAPASWPASLPLESLELEPKIDWAGGFRKAWEPGEVGGRKSLKSFADKTLKNYHEARDFPGLQGTSRLSPYLHFGEVSPLQLWQALDGRSGSEAYLREIAWREFAYHLLFHFPRTPSAPLRREYEKFPWKKDDAALKAWQKGRTGYPIVDAGMRELWATGWMHNRVRMIVASFLVKDLLISWQDGARWFWDTLVDADLANNTLGWQWTAGCGADAAPFFRIFNPVTQGEKYDPQGTYIRRWVPEIAHLPDDRIHQPYGQPLVDHAAARERALAALKRLKS